MEHFLRDLRSLDASDFERLAKAQDATRRHRRAEAYRMNEGGWEAQMKNIATHVGQAP